MQDGFLMLCTLNSGDSGSPTFETVLPRGSAGGTQEKHLPRRSGRQVVQEWQTATYICTGFGAQSFDITRVR